MEYAAGDTLDVKFDTAAGVPTTLVGGTVSVYKGNDIAQTVTGVTLTVDFDGVTGLHNVRVVTTDAFYVNDETYHLVITAGTVAGVSVVGKVVGSFQLTAAAAAAQQVITGTVDDTGFTPTTTEFEADDITEATTSHYNGRIVIFTSGALVGQASDITAYSLASGRGHFTVTALTEAPGNNDTFVIV